MAELVVDALVENLNKVLAFVEEHLESYGCSIKAAMRIQIAVEEMYVNIAHYAYEGTLGTATILMEHLPEQGAVKIVLKDSGKPYNPLEKEDPDVTLSTEERPIGGLGIYMVKNSMDDVKYDYISGHNIFSFSKSW